MKTHTITPVVPLAVHDDKFFLREQVGKGSLGDIEFTVSTLLSCGDMAIEIAERLYVVDTRTLVEAAVAEHERLEAASGEVSA